MSTPDLVSHSRSASRSRDNAVTPPPQPTTPLRPPSRSSLRSSHGHAYSPQSPASKNPLGSLEPVFAELSDGMADLEANFMHLQLMHESLARFTECFASFLYGLNVNAFCVDFPEAPIPESFRRAQENPAFTQPEQQRQTYSSAAADSAGMDPDQTFMTSDTSFVENPPASSVQGLGSSTPRGKPLGSRGQRGGTTRGASTRGGTSTRGGVGAGRGTAASTRGRASGLPRGPSARGRGATR